MMLILKLMLVLAAVALAGCASTPPPQPVTIVKTIVPEIPAACDPVRDPKWREPPDADLRAEDLVRLDRINSDAFATLEGSRRQCDAGLAVYRKVPR